MAEPVGRPTKLTDELVKKLEWAFSIGASIPEACFHADITVVTYYNWKKENEELFNRFDELRHNPILKAKLATYKGLDDPEFALKYLTKKKRDEFGDRLDLTTNGKDINSNQTINLSAFTQEELDNLEQLTRKAISTTDTDKLGSTEGTI